MTQSTTFQLFDFVVYTDLDVDLKGVTPYKTLKEELNNKNHFDDNYSAPFACRSFAFQFFKFFTIFETLLPN